MPIPTPGNDVFGSLNGNLCIKTRRTRHGIAAVSCYIHFLFAYEMCWFR